MAAETRKADIRKRAAEKRGHRGERLAALLLLLKGHRILGRQVKTDAGEIDLVSLPVFGPVCFVEVKARRLARDAVEAVAPAQRTRIARAASLYLASRRPLPGAAPASILSPSREYQGISRMCGGPMTDVRKSGGGKKS